MSKYTSASTYPWKDELEHYRTLAEQAGPLRQTAGIGSASWHLLKVLFALTRHIRTARVQLSTRSRVWRDIILHQPMRWLRRFWLTRGVQICLTPQRQPCHRALMPWSKVAHLTIILIFSGAHDESLYVVEITSA